MISAFTIVDESDVLNSFLLGQGSVPSHEQFTSKWFGGSKQFGRYDFYRGQKHILSDAQHKLCVRFLDLMWKLKVFSFICARLSWANL